MKIIRFFLLLLLSLSAAGANAQQKKLDKNLNKEMEKVFGKTVDPPKEYKEAEAIVQKAIEALKKGEVNNADSLIFSAIKVYPARAVFNYVKEVCRMPDLNRGSAIMEKLYETVKSFPEPKIVMIDFFPSVFENGILVKGIREYQKERALFNFGYDIFQMNKDFGNLASATNALKRILDLNIINTSTENSYDVEYNMMQSSRVVLAQMQREYDKALTLAKQIPVTKYFSEETKQSFLISIYCDKADYDKALQLLDSIKTPLLLSLQKFKVNALLGNNEEAMANYNEYIKAEYVYITNDLFYYLAIIDLDQKKYDVALKNLDSALNHKMDRAFEGMGTMFIDKWKVYKLIGDAYFGLQLYEKAKDNYTISLLSNPDYEPAAAALVKLEATIAQVTSTDKTSPVIVLLEPSPKRGLKVTAAGANVMIKGIATDPSGLKEVKINNKIVYAQKGGDFWGEIPLAEGLNKVTVVATDFAGNKGEQIFEIERQKAKANVEIVPVLEKEGRNYCLLIAAQNYSDNNIPSLTNPVADAVKLKLIFKNNYNFAEENIITLFNPELNDVKRQLLELTNVLQPEDNLVIFYAGHGIWVEKEKKGYWLLTDSKRHDVNTWLPNKTVLDLIAKVPSRHTLLITDACFSGSVFKTRGLGKDAPAAMKEMDEKISRVAITSGNDTEVPDESVFMKYLVKALSENKEKFLTAQKMFINQIIEAVMTETKTEPRYGTLELAGHVGGDYIFSKK